MMQPPSIALWCYVVLFFASSFSESRENSMNDDERRGDSTTVRYDLFVNSTRDRDDEIRHKPRINFTNEDHIIDSMRYKSHGHIMKFREVNMGSMGSPENSMEANDENDSISQRFNGNSNGDNYNDTFTIVTYEACGNETCIQLCCSFGERLTSEKCVAGQDNYTFPDVQQSDSENRRLDELFQLTIRDPCVLQGSAHRILNPDEYSFLVNGSLYQDPGQLVPATSYCLAASDGRDVYEAIVCIKPIGFPTYMSVCLIVSLPFLLSTFVVYSILPEVQNIHSYTLRVHVASLFISNVVIFCVQQFPVLSEWKYCIPLVYIFNFSMLSSCFWLNATCFDIWWTFKKLNLQQPHIKKKKKKFIMYSIYAWGITFTLTVACAIMDHAPGISKDLIQPEMCKRKFWFGSDEALTVYFYGPTGTAFISNICFFIATALAILYHNKYTAHQLRDSESRRYDNKKRKFTMYLKLFIVMGVSWSMGIILWLINASDTIPQMVWNVSYTIDILQGVIIFLIYICKRKILRLLLKRFGLQDRDPWTKSSSSQCTRTSSNMSYASSISGSIHMQKINPINEAINRVSNAM